MGNADNKIGDFVDIVKSWIPRKTDPPSSLSRDFWMPDHSCRVCYECDSQFTVFNRRHHCRICGRVFCAKCTAHSIPAPFDEPRSSSDDCERIRVCNYCFKQWDQGIAVVDNGNGGNPNAGSTGGLSLSPSATSLVSTKSSCTCNSSSSTVGSGPYSTGPYHRVPQLHNSSISPQQSQMDPAANEAEHDSLTPRRSTTPVSAFCSSSNQNQFGYCMSRSDDEDDDYSVYRSISETGYFSNCDSNYGPVASDEIDQMYGSHEMHQSETLTDANDRSSPLVLESFDTQAVDRIKNTDDIEGDGYEAPYDGEDANVEPVDFENNGLLWLPPEPEDDEDERDADLFDDDDEDDAVTGEWGYLRPMNSFGSQEFRTRDKSSEEHRKAMKNVVKGHFRALVSQLLQVENLPVGDEDDHKSWLQIITSLSWEAASFLKPDTSKSGGMDPGGYVKVKCIASGHRNESTVVKGVVCKKNVAHRRMISKFDKPRFLILGGALEYQRVSNLLSSVDTLLQQEMDHLKMAVAKIDAHHPDVLLVEKSVSRYAQEYLLTKDISLVLNIKRPLLERIARCTGAQIVPSVDHLTSQNLGFCEKFHVEKFLEEHGSAGQGGKKLTKTLMFFEGCPRPLGCTILLKGASGDELKKAKHVVQYGVFAAYHLALETSFLADEGASLPELPLKSPINVALPDKPLKIDRSISIIPGFTIPGAGKPSGSQSCTEVERSSEDANELQKPIRGTVSSTTESANAGVSNSESLNSMHLTKDYKSQAGNSMFALSATDSTSFSASLSPSTQDASGPCSSALSSFSVFEEGNFEKYSKFKNSQTNVLDDQLHPNVDASVALEQNVGSNLVNENALALKGDANQSFLKQDGGNQNEDIGSSKDFPPSPSDHQSILVSLSSRCVWKGTVCERAHLFRIKYYGSFDKPLGRFLRDHLFDQNYCCRSCQMPAEAHVHCYTHRQGSLTISAKKLPEFLLPGEREGKIWMWHRCLKCPRTNGFPRATRRVAMSDAAWGLSFGKFLELSFSNHAAASRVASCGHSLHRDCLRFYGFGRMVACFRYASITVHSVHLPPPKVEFNYDHQEWIQKEADEVCHRAELLFAEVNKALLKIQDKFVASGSANTDTKPLELTRLRFVELEAILQKEREEFEEALTNALSGEAKAGQPATDVLEINKLRRQILFHSYVWDQRLINAAGWFKTNQQVSLTSFIPKLKDKSISSVEKLAEMDMMRKPVKGFSSFDSFLLETKPEINFSRGGNEDSSSQPDVHKGSDAYLNPTAIIDTEISFSSIANTKEDPDPCDPGKVVRRVHSEGEFQNRDILSDGLGAAWTGKNNHTNMVSEENGCSLSDSAKGNVVVSKSDMDKSIFKKGGSEGAVSLGSVSPSEMPQNTENSPSMGMPFPTFKSSWNPEKLGIRDYNPVYISVFKELERQSGAKLLLPIGVNDTAVPVYDDEPTSIIAYALVSSDYHHQMSELERTKDALESGVSLPLLDSVNLLSFNFFDDSASDAFRSLGSTDESILSVSGSRGSLVSDLLSFTKDLHVRVSFTDDGPQGKVKYTVTCYYAKRFEALRRTCCPSELDFIRSLSRCKKWGAQGGKSNVFFAKTLDDRFIIKQVTKTELESFIKFGPSYFKYLLESIGTGGPTCLAKILGIYQVSSKHLKGGKESKMDVLVMENLLFRRNITRLYDLKGSSRSRYNPDTSGNNKVLLDQNLIEAMPTSPIFVGNKAKRLLERAVWNDTSFLASVDVMDYSLLVGVDEERHELVLGIIDFMRQYTWDKHLETWVKTSGILGGSKNTTPTVISPQQYKKRFRKAMTAYFLMVPDQWSPPMIIPSGSQSDLYEEGVQGGLSCE